MEEEEEEDYRDDVLTKVTNFVDRNLRIFRGFKYDSDAEISRSASRMTTSLSAFVQQSLSWVLAGAGVLLILRRTYVFWQFKAVSDVPTEFVTKNISLRGHVREVRQDNTLGVCHIPLVRAFKDTYFSSQKVSSSQSNLLTVSLLGVEFRDGGHKWLLDNLLSAEVHMTPLQVSNNALECILYKKEDWFSSMCVNEELVRQGVAVTCHVSTLVKSTPYMKLQRQLLKAELRAEKKGIGIWARPSLMRKLQRLLSLPAFKIKQVASAVQRVSFRISFFKKGTKG